MLIERELQARLLKETSDLYARKQQLEDKIRNLDVLNNSLQNTAAIRDIEAHKARVPSVVEKEKGVFSRYRKTETGSWGESDRGGIRL
jgi:hypothetical protein